MLKLCWMFFLVIACEGIEADDSNASKQKENRDLPSGTFSPVMDEIVFGLLNVAKYHPKRRVSLGAVFLAGLQSNKYLQSVATNIIMRYAVTNGSLISFFGSPYSDSTDSDKEFNTLMDAVQMAIEERDFDFVVPDELRDPDFESSEVVQLFRNGLNYYRMHKQDLGESRPKYVDKQHGGAVPSSPPPPAFSKSLIDELAVIEEMDSEGSGEVQENVKPIVKDFPSRGREPRRADDLLENLYVRE